MKQWMAIWRQRGGCDYTIGCGIAHHYFDADTHDAAVQYVVGQLAELEDNDLAESIEQVDLIEIVNNTTTLMPGVWAAERHERQAAKAEARDAVERAEYERLKRKFEGK